LIAQELCCCCLMIVVAGVAEPEKSV
jgi:hypothetical protein